MANRIGRGNTQSDSFLDKLKASGSRIDSRKWYSFFDAGDYIVMRYESLIPHNKEKNQSCRILGTTADGEAMQVYGGAILESSLETLEPGTVVLIEYKGKVKHPSQPRQALKLYEVYTLGYDFPADAPSPDWDAVAERIKAKQDSDDGMPF